MSIRYIISVGVAAVAFLPIGFASATVICPDLNVPGTSYTVDCDGPNDFDDCRVCVEDSGGIVCDLVPRVEARLLLPGYCAFPGSSGPSLTTAPSAPPPPVVHQLVVPQPSARGISVPLPPPSITAPAGR